MDTHSTNSFPRCVLGSLLLATAICASLWLGYSSLVHGAIAGCNEGCSEVLSSPWANLFGIPIALLGLATYLLLAFSAFVKKATLFLFTASLIILGALYFTALQAFVIKSWCPWCCTAHAAAVLATFLLGFRVSGITSRALLIPATAAGLAIAGLATAQTLFPNYGKAFFAEIASPSQSADPDLIVLHSGAITLRESDYPVLSPDSPGAQNRLLFISDYDCGTCIRLKLSLNDWIKRPDCPARVVQIPVGRTENARSLLRYLHAARLHDPSLYEEIDALLTNREIPSADLAVKRRLEEKLGSPEKLAAIMEQYGSKADDLLAAADSLFRYNATIIPQLKGIVPQVLVGNRILSGQIPSDETIAAALDNRSEPILGIEPATPVPNDFANPAPGIAPQPAPPTFAPSSGTIQPTYSTFDLGESAPGNKFYTSLGITNTGSDSATLTNIQIPPGVKLMTQLPLTLAPDENSALSLEITAPATPGAFELPIIFTDQGGLRTRITGKVLKP